MNTEEYINSRLDDQIKWYDRKSQISQNWHKRLRVAELVFAAFLPLLAGYINKYPLTMTITIGVLGVLIAVIAGLLGVFKFQENWVEYRTTCETLKKEKILFLANVEPYDMDDIHRFKNLVQRVESLISKENTNWAYYIAQEKEQKTSK